MRDECHGKQMAAASAHDSPNMSQSSFKIKLVFNLF
jgi:hypothetical protein